MDEYMLNTDLALEKVLREEKIQNIDGTKMTTDENESRVITDIVIETEEAANIIGKPVGRYITLEIRDDEYSQSTDAVSDDLCR